MDDEQDTIIEDLKDDRPVQINPHGSEHGALLKYGAFNSQAKIVEDDGMPYIVIPKDYDLLRMQRFLKNPLRPEVDLTFTYWEDFMAYAKKFKTVATIAFFTQNMIMIIFDYHKPAVADGEVTAAWLDHKIRFYAEDEAKAKSFLSKFREAKLCEIFSASSSVSEPKKEGTE